MTVFVAVDEPQYGKAFRPLAVTEQQENSQPLRTVLGTDANWSAMLLGSSSSFVPASPSVNWDLGITFLQALPLVSLAV